MGLQVALVDVERRDLLENVVQRLLRHCGLSAEGAERRA